MDKTLKTAFVKAVKYWQGLSKKLRVIICVGVSVALLLALAGPFLLNQVQNGNMTVLYHNLSVDESSKILTTLQDMNVSANMNNKGEITVPSSEVNMLKLQLSSMGYPKSGLSYDNFKSNTGFLSTELEKKQYLLMDLQERIQSTLKLMSGISDVVVTLNVPQNTSSVWDAATQKSTASVMVMLETGNHLTTANVRTIKEHVASSVPLLASVDVVVTNAATGMELDTSSNPEMDGNRLQLDFEKAVEQKIEEKVLNLLTLPYGLDNVRVSASATLDYDRILSEEMKYTGDEEGKGIMSQLEEWYKNNNDGISGIVGEEDNTDLNTYPVIGGDGQEIDEFSNSAEFLVSYIKTQIEKNAAVLKSSSVSVVIHNNELTDEDKTNWKESIAKAVNVNVEDVMINSFYKGTNVPSVVIPPVVGMFSTQAVILLVGIGVLALVIVILLVLYYQRKTKRLMEMTEEAERSTTDTMVRLEEEQRNRDLERAQAQNSKTQTNLQSIQEFAAQNPEIAAALIRDMLKEDE